MTKGESRLTLAVAAILSAVRRGATPSGKAAGTTTSPRSRSRKSPRGPDRSRMRRKVEALRPVRRGRQGLNRRATCGIHAVARGIRASASRTRVWLIELAVTRHHLGHRDARLSRSDASPARGSCSRQVLRHDCHIFWPCGDGMPFGQVNRAVGGYPLDRLPWRTPALTGGRAAAARLEAFDGWR
jgi:hypothetical protein